MRRFWLAPSGAARLIDEWQIAPNLWDAVRVSVDRRGEKGLYLLTGSVVVDDKKIKHSGTGRISRLEMSTMSLYETQETSGELSLKGLFDAPGAAVDGAKSALPVEQLIFACAVADGLRSWMRTETMQSSS